MNKNQYELCYKYALVIPKALDKLSKNDNINVGFAIDESIKDLGLDTPPQNIHDALVVVIGKALMSGRFEGFPDA